MAAELQEAYAAALFAFRVRRRGFGKQHPRTTRPQMTLAMGRGPRSLADFISDDCFQEKISWQSEWRTLHFA